MIVKLSANLWTLKQKLKFRSEIAFMARSFEINMKNMKI